MFHFESPWLRFSEFTKPSSNPRTANWYRGREGCEEESRVATAHTWERVNSNPRFWFQIIYSDCIALMANRGCLCLCENELVREKALMQVKLMSGMGTAAQQQNGTATKNWAFTQGSFILLHQPLCVFYAMPERACVCDKYYTYILLSFYSFLSFILSWQRRACALSKYTWDARIHIIHSVWYERT